MTERRILFLAEACLLDTGSGAAHSARAMLHALAGAGWRAMALTMTVCDGEAEHPLAARHPELDPAHGTGTLADLSDGALIHRIHVLPSTRQRAVRPWDMRAFIGQAGPVIAAFRPDLVLTYGSDLLRPLLRQAQQLGARTVFYLAHAGQTRRDPAAFAPFDDIVAPSRALAELCQARLGRTARVVASIVTAPFDGRRNLDPARIAGRRGRFVTIVNPAPGKGGLFFINLAARAATLAPDLRFRAVEGRFGRAGWARLGVAADHLDRIDWHPATADMAAVYDDAALLLVPSLAFEGAGRVIAEAQLAGIPVLAMNSGGIAEQLHEGGFLFDPTAALVDNPLATPDGADLDRWLQFIQVLLHDDAIFARAVRLALRAGRAHDPAARAAGTAVSFGAILDDALAALAGGDPALPAALADLRQRLDDERAAANALALAPGRAATGPQDSAYAPLLQRSLAQPVLRDALAAINARDWPRARALLEPYLRVMPDDLAALGLLAEVADAQEREGEASQLLARAIELAPGFVRAQMRLVNLLRQTGDAQGALAHAAALRDRLPDQPRVRALHAGLLTAANRFDDAIAAFAGVLRETPGTVHDWMQYALALKTVGRQAEGVAAYRKAIERAPRHGAAWHGLSNLKLNVFADADIDQMEGLLRGEGLTDDDRCNLHFTLGKAHEDHRHYAPSFRHYAEANRIRRAATDYDAGRLETFVAEAKALFTADFFAARAGQGDPARDPVFVLGLHRAGSTLVEQILASHPAIEGTRELPHMLRIGRDFGGIGPRGQARALNAGLLADLAGPELARLGRRYLDLAAPDRHAGRPMFVDKMPANWMYAGLIHLILPNARIIDIRRAPMAAGFALFKMNFGRGVDHSYDQRDIARYYRAYADLMAHFDTVLPGRIHRIRYEDLVDGTEDEIRRLIAYCGLPFDDACLRYWETERAIQTPSSEQVRQPIYRTAVEQWRHYAEWLGPLRAGFGDLVAADAAPPVTEAV